jgi:hypothetical protein
LQHNQRINVIGALLITPAGRKIKRRAKRHEINFTGEQIIDFLKHLNKITADQLNPILRHSQISLTMNTYAHVMPAMKQEAIGMMDSILSRK